MGRFIYESVPGFFIQDELTHTDTIPTIADHLGLKKSSDSDRRWDGFRDDIKKLNSEAEEGVQYKFFLLSRHGQGYHNVAESKYGTEAWDNHWAKLNGDGEIVWGPDPLLTPLGESQAEDIQTAMLREVLGSFSLEAPHKRYCSPLTRAMHTCRKIYDGIFAHVGAVMVLEDCREENGVHTCDKRSTRSHIAASFPEFEIEDGLTENDELWDADVRETKAALATRAGKVLDRVFEKDKEATFISITAHGGWINGFLTAVGRQTIPLPTGGVLPLVVKGKWVE